MVRTTCRWVACLLTVGLYLGSGGAAAASQDWNGSVDRQVVLRVRRPQQDGQLLVRWQRVATREGGQFLLYRGADRDSLQRVARLAVDNGDIFEVSESATWEGQRIYQLRYLDRQGREHVLTTVLLELSNIEERPQLELLTRGISQPLDSALLWCLQNPDFHPQPPPFDALASMGEVPAPPSPPPRIAGYSPRSIDAHG